MTNPKGKPSMTLSSPEDGLTLRPNINPMDQDMLQGILSRSTALVSILSGYFETPIEDRGFKVSDHTLSNILWQLNGNLQLIGNMVMVGLSEE